jgi:hypothetical protein
MGVIYKLEFESGKSYIGQTVRELRVRIAVHRQSVAAGSMLPVHCAWRLHGEPKISVIGECDDVDELHDMERAAIREHFTRAPNGYNVSHGGDTAPSKTASVAAKIAEKAKGRKVRDDVKEVIREKMKLRWQDPEYVERVKAGLRNAQGEELSRKYSERNNKVWAAKKEAGWTMPEATKEKIRAKAKAMTDETKAKMSESAKKRGPPLKALAASLAANKGVKRGPYSQDRKNKAAEGIKAAWQDPEKRERLMAARKAAWVTRKAKMMKEE